MGQYFDHLTDDYIINNFWSLFNLISSLVSQQLIFVLFFFLLVIFMHLLHFSETYMSVFGFKVKASCTLGSNVLDTIF